jgi:cytochrome c-type biogenesis protein CcmF
MIGNIGIIVSFVSSLIAGFLFFRRASTDKPLIGVNDPALVFYHLHTLGLVISSVYLMYALLTHQFQYYYVYAHSSLNLPVEYLVSAFWAGQEGTFLLWALFTAAAGYLLINKEKELISAMMPFILTGQAFLMLFLILENPFFHLGQQPADGLGLNPLLMDPWMVIHPPIIFIGYSLLIFPFSYAVAALWKQDWEKGLLRALPWVAAGWFFLGAGILIGGAWAYRVLGWGGYWGWDPVENASLIPWLTGTALLHGLIAQKQKGLFVKSNLLLSIITFALIIFATFLTRSGVMAEYSVHAFAETSLTYALAAFNLVFFLSGLTLFIKRYELLPRGKDTIEGISRKSIFALTLLLLSASALLVLLGTLSPVLTGFFGSPSSVDENFYLQTNTPLIFILMIALALCPVAMWKQESIKEIFKRLKIIICLTPLALIIGYFMGIKSTLGMILFGGIYFAAAVNILQIIQIWKKGIKYSGGYIAHLGLALLLIGFLASTAYTESQVLALSKGVKTEALGYNFTFLEVLTENNDNYLLVEIEDDSDTYLARPNMYFAGGRLMRSPHISRSALQDLYISPIEVQVSDNREVFILTRDETQRVLNYSFTFREFSFEPHTDTGVIEVGAILEIDDGTNLQEYLPTIRQDPEGRVSDPVILSGGELLYLDEIDADTGMIRLFLEIDSVSDRDEVFVVEVKVKPLISFLIIGASLLMVGSGISVWRRFTL